MSGAMFDDMWSWLSLVIEAIENVAKPKHLASHISEYHIAMVNLEGSLRKLADSLFAKKSTLSSKFVFVFLSNTKTS